MTIRITTDFRHLMELARALGQARQSGDEQQIQLAQREHDAYKELCLKADDMILGVPAGDL